MNRYIASGLFVAGLAAGCANEQTSNKVDQLQLTVSRETYAYDPEAAGLKGSGDLGQADKPLKMGTRILAECVDRPDSDVEDTGITDAIQLADTEFKGQLVPLRVHPAVNGKIADEPVPVFNLSPDEIRDQLEFC